MIASYKIIRFPLWSQLSNNIYCASVVIIIAWFPIEQCVNFKDVRTSSSRLVTAFVREFILRGG